MVTIGVITRSGRSLAEKYRAFDAKYKFEAQNIKTQESTLCHSGEVLQGLLKPHQCRAFGKEYTPRKPPGATVISSEGACADYYNYEHLSDKQTETRSLIWI